MGTQLSQVIGAIPSHVINLMLNLKLARKTSARVVKFVNDHPNWLAAVDEHILVRTDFGFSFHCSRRSGIGQTLVAEGRWEGLMSRTIQACLREGDSAIDIGANIGYDTLLMSNSVGQGGTVLAFEPLAQHMTLLLKNIRHGGCGNIIAQSIALSDQSGLANISLENEYNSGTPNLRPGNRGPSQPILVARLDSLLNEDLFPSIRFVKIDVEGFDLKAILGMGRLIERVEYLTCEVNEQFLKECGGSPQALFDYMKEQGFICFCAEPVSDGQWVASDHSYQIQDPEGHHFDALFCRNVHDSLKQLIKC